MASEMILRGKWSISEFGREASEIKLTKQSQVQEKLKMLKIELLRSGPLLAKPFDITTFLQLSISLIKPRNQCPQNQRI